ncbi:MAG: hypothetical protein ACLQLG_14060 [Thermoguttaceae bacterium]
MKRLKKILKWSGIVLAAVAAIGLVANAVFVWTTDTRLERQLAAIRAAGDPIRLADLARPPLPPDKNAATFLRRAKAGVDAISKETWGVPRFWEYLYTDDPMPAEIQKALKAALAAYPDVIPLLEQAAACPDYDAQWDYTVPPLELNMKMLPEIQVSRENGRLLQLRVRLLIAQGNYDDAARTAVVLFRLARHYRRNPFLINYLVALTMQGMAVDSANTVLQAGPVSSGVRGALDRELAIQERMEGFVWTLKSEQAYMVEMFRTAIPHRNFWLVSRGYWNREESACLEVSRDFIALADDPRPYCDVEPAIEHQKPPGTKPIEQQVISPESPMSGLAALTFPAHRAVYAAGVRTRARIRTLRVLNDLQTHVPPGSGEAPKLTALGLPAETITDPFNGAPLHVKKTPRGWLVYSVGPNLQDDGGKVDDPVHGDVGVGPPPAAKPAGK